MTLKDEENKPQSNDKRAELLAWYYVNASGFNKTKAYKYYKLDVGDDLTGKTERQIRNAACNYFKYKDVEKWVNHFVEENRKEYTNQRDKNITHLNEILDDETSTKKERIDAIKELNCMFGWQKKDLNINGSVKEDITVEIV